MFMGVSIMIESRRGSEEILWCHSSFLDRPLCPYQPVMIAIVPRLESKLLGYYLNLIVVDSYVLLMQLMTKSYLAN